MDVMVELAGITKRFGDCIALQQFDLRAQPGEFITLLGPSGCGKSTALRLISGLEIPDEGRVLLGGKDVTDLPAYERDVNQVFQSYALFPHMNVAGNIAFGLRMKKVPDAEVALRVKAVSELVSLAGLETRKPHQLSGGQRQRAALARAIVCQPKVLLLDEPLSALDANLRQAMQMELKQLQKRLGITFIYVTHDQAEALTISDRIAVMNHGRLEQFGSVAEIYHRPRTKFVAGFLGQANILELQLCGESGAFKRAQVLPHGFELLLHSDGAGDGKRLVCIRPEKIRMTKQPLPTVNCFDAVVSEKYFQGATERILLRLESGIRLTALTSCEQGGFQVGEKLFCELPPEAIVPLRQG